MYLYRPRKDDTGRFLPTCICLAVNHTPIFCLFVLLFVSLYIYQYVSRSTSKHAISTKATKSAESATDWLQISSASPHPYFISGILTRFGKVAFLARFLSIFGVSAFCFSNWRDAKGPYWNLRAFSVPRNFRTDPNDFREL